MNPLVQRVISIFDKSGDGQGKYRVVRRRYGTRADDPFVLASS